MDRADIRSKIVELLTTVEPRLKGTTIEEHTFLTDLGISSLKLIEIGVLLDDTFGGTMRFDDWLEQERGKSEGGFSMESLISFVHQSREGGHVST